MQERLLGAALGTVLTSVVVFEQRKSIYKSISENQSRFSPQSQVCFPLGCVFSFVIFTLCLDGCNLICCVVLYFLDGHNIWINCIVSIVA